MVHRLAWVSLVLGGCGLPLVGSALSVSDGGDLPGDGPAALDAGTPDGTALVSQDAAVVAPDGAIVAVDAAKPTDAPVDVVPPPNPAKVSLSFSAGKDQKVYKLDIVSNVFTALPSAGCPSAEETAIFTDGTLFVTSFDNKDLYRVTPTGCTAIRTNSKFPYALGTAPVGTVSQTREVLVGYMGAGDYVRVDETNGDVTVILANALGTLRPSGDVTALGTKGYLAAAANTGSGAFACPNGGDCIAEVDLVTGAPIKLIKQFTGLGIYGLAHSHGNLLFYANSQVFPFDPSAQTLGSAIAGFPAGASFSGAAAAPYPPP